MTKAELIAELEWLAREWHDRLDAHALNENHWIGVGFDQAADELDELIAKAKQTTDTTP